MNRLLYLPVSPGVQSLAPPIGTHHPGAVQQAPPVIVEYGVYAARERARGVALGVAMQVEFERAARLRPFSIHFFNYLKPCAFRSVCQIEFNLLRPTLAMPPAARWVPKSKVRRPIVHSPHTLLKNRLRVPAFGRLFHASLTTLTFNVYRVLYDQTTPDRVYKAYTCACAYNPFIPKLSSSARRVGVRGRVKMKKEERKKAKKSSERTGS